MRHLVEILGLSLLVLTISRQVSAVEFQPPVFRSNNALGAGGSKVIRGLLVVRQACNSGYGYCRTTGVCCPVGGRCCSDRESCVFNGRWLVTSISKDVAVQLVNGAVLLDVSAPWHRG